MALLGILTAVVIVFSQIYCFQEACQHKEKLTKTEQHQDNKKAESHKAFFTMPSSIIPSSASIESTQETAFICVVSGEKKEVTPHIQEFPVFLTKFFQTLFRIIISPNAP